MSRRAKQQSFFRTPKKFFGGSLLKGNPREKRPFTTKNPLHLILKSNHASHEWAFTHKNNKQKVDACLRKQAKLNGIKNYGIQIMYNHLHLNMQFPSRQAYHRFVRAISGIIPRIVMGAERGRASLLEKFWAARPFTSIINWGRHFETIKKYFQLNRLEALGFSRPYARLVLTESG